MLYTHKNSKREYTSICYNLIEDSKIVMMSPYQNATKTITLRDLVKVKETGRKSRSSLRDYILLKYRESRIEFSMVKLQVAKWSSAMILKK